MRAASTSTSESEIDIELCDDSEDDQDYERYCEEICMQDEENNEKNTQTDKNEVSSRKDKSNLNVVQNDWLLVKFCTKQSVKYYVGIVLHTNDDGVPFVKYVRKIVTKIEGQTVFTYPTLEDISDVKHQEDIVAKLPKPVIGRRGQIIFKMSFQNFNVQ